MKGVRVKSIDKDWLQLINKKYSQYGPIEDFSPEGDIGNFNLSWAVAKKIVLERDQYRCRICSKSILHERSENFNKIKIDVEVHHIIPRKIGGSNSPRNLITLCHECHVSTFKNQYGGLPRVKTTGDSTFFTDIRNIYDKIEKKEQITVNEIYLNGNEIKLDTGLRGYLCYTDNFNDIENSIIDFDPDIILLKNPKNNKFIRGYITP